MEKGKRGDRGIRRWQGRVSLVMAAILLAVSPTTAFGDTGEPETAVEAVTAAAEAAAPQPEPEPEAGEVAPGTGEAGPADDTPPTTEAGPHTVEQPLEAAEEAASPEDGEDVGIASVEPSASSTHPEGVPEGLAEPVSGIIPLGLWGNAPQTITARVTLYPPPYGRSSENPNNYGFYGTEWAYIYNNGFTGERGHSSVSIVSGYTGNDWLYGAYGDPGQVAGFAANRAVKCIDIGDTPPVPGGDNTRDVVMGYVGETTYNGRQYYLYWGSEYFDGRSAYAYGNGPQRMGTYIAIPREYGDPVRVVAQKIDAATGGPYGQDDPSGGRLAGAQFTMRFWEGQYYNTAAQAEAASLPTRTWIVETEGNGRASLDNLVVGSDPLYYDPLGDPMLPLGTVVIQETKAPDGYLLPNPNIPSIQQITYDGTLDQVTAYNPPTILEQPRIVEVSKADAADGRPLPGASYVLMFESAPGRGDWQQLYTEKTTDAAGKASWSPVPAGSYKVVETSPPPGYMLPSTAGMPDEQAFTVSATGTEQTTSVPFVNHLMPTLEVQKADSATGAPVSDTEFTLYSYPGIAFTNGSLAQSVLGISAESPAWLEVGRAVTDNNGKAVFSGLPFGYYLLSETRPNPLYASYGESGGQPHMIVLDQGFSGEAQLFEDELVQVSVLVYKKTIQVTSSALDGTAFGAVNNVGAEEYHYNLGAMNTSGVYVDEFVIIDDLTAVTSLGYRMTTLWTGTSPAGLDFDDKVTVLYKTNQTPPGTMPAFNYDIMAANPFNPNNPTNRMVKSAPAGWRVWAEALSTVEATRLDVSSLGLAEGEFVTGLMMVYGGVRPGFYVGRGYGQFAEPNSLRSGSQVNDHSRPAELYDWQYAVVATGPLTPLDSAGMETVMRGSAVAEVSRNTVLADDDYDQVETRVIKPFSFPLVFKGLVAFGSRGQYPGLPPTGDSAWPLAAALSLTLIGTVIIRKAQRRRSKAVARQP